MWKLATLVCLLVATAAAFVYTFQETAAGPSKPTFIVNSTGDEADADVGVAACEIAPAASGLCTLRAAFQQANALGSGIITFDTTVFPVGTPATIAVGATLGELPQITVPLLIDATGAGVIIAPAASVMLDYGLFVLDTTPATPTDFTLTGNGMILRNFDDTGATAAEGDGIVLCGDTGNGCGTGAIDADVSDVVVQDAQGRGVIAGAGDDSDILIEHSSLFGVTQGLLVFAGDSSRVRVRNNVELSGGDGAVVNATDDANIEFTDNDNFVGGDNGISIDAGDSSRIRVVNNTHSQSTDGDALTVSTGDEGDVAINLNGTFDGGDNSIEATTGANGTLSIEDNETLTAVNDQGLQIELGDSSTAHVQRQHTIHTDRHNAIELTLAAGDTVDVSDNTSITGPNGISLEATGDADVTVADNGEIIGSDGKSMELAADGLTVHIDWNSELTGQTSSAIHLSGRIDGGTITNNTTIKGAGKRGIDITPSGVDGAISDLRIANNAIVSSAEEGIRFKCDPAECTGGTGNTVEANAIMWNGLEGIRIEGGGLLGEIGISGNTIMNNAGPGVRLLDTNDNTISGNLIQINGTAHTGIAVEMDATNARGNTISRNSIFDNQGLGIDLADNQLTPNDAGDTDGGPNDLLNFPEALQVNAGPGTITGTACTGCLVEVFATGTPDSSGHGEGQTFIGDAVADGSGHFTFSITGAACGAAAGNVSATATDADGNTSEFAANASGFAGTAPCPATPTVTPTPGGPTATPTATNTPMPQPTATATSQPTSDGDVNKNGTTDSIDATLILQNIAGLIPMVPYPDNADVNQDGHIDSIDATLILQYNAGLINHLPV